MQIAFFWLKSSVKVTRDWNYSNSVMLSLPLNLPLSLFLCHTGSLLASLPPYLLEFLHPSLPSPALSLYSLTHSNHYHQTPQAARFMNFRLENRRRQEGFISSEKTAFDKLKNILCKVISSFSEEKFLVMNLIWKNKSHSVWLRLAHYLQYLLTVEPLMSCLPRLRAHNGAEWLPNTKKGGQQGDSPCQERASPCGTHICVCLYLYVSGR